MSYNAWNRGKGKGKNMWNIGGGGYGVGGGGFGGGGVGNQIGALASTMQWQME